MSDLITTSFFSIIAAGFFVGVVVGLTGMGGGALMTPARSSWASATRPTVVTADLTAAAIYKSAGRRFTPARAPPTSISRSS